MYLSRSACHHFEPSHQGGGTESLDRRSMCFRGLDISFGHRRQCPADEAVARTERALASLHCSCC
jgi:hypothetical protein